MDLAILLFQIIGAFFFLLVTCEFGGRMTIAHDDIDTAILQLSWYRFPVELKKLLPILMSMSQKEIELRGMGSVACSRETFQRVRS